MLKENAMEPIPDQCIVTLKLFWIVNFSPSPKLSPRDYL